MVALLQCAVDEDPREDLLVSQNDLFPARRSGEILRQRQGEIRVFDLERPIEEETVP